jgi:hypothetical protein
MVHASAEDEHMMLLDVEQLQAVQEALNSLPSLNSRQQGSSSGGHTSAACEGALPTISEAEVRKNGGGADKPLPLPMLLSCGIFEWLPQVLEQCTGTYSIPATAQVIQQVPPQHPQQQPTALKMDKSMLTDYEKAAAPAEMAASAFAQRPNHQPRPTNCPEASGDVGGQSKHGVVAAPVPSGVANNASTAVEGKDCNEQRQPGAGNRVAGQVPSQRSKASQSTAAGVVSSDAGRGRGGPSSRRSALRLSSRCNNGKQQTT